MNVTESSSTGDIMVATVAKFHIGQVVRHRIFPFRGVIFDVDPEFNHTDEWYEAIPADIRPQKNQPFYHVFAENKTDHYEAYVSEQNLLPDTTGDPVEHPMIAEIFGPFLGTRYELTPDQTH